MTAAPHLPVSRSAARPGLLLASFVVLVFCTGTAEYLVAGILPQLARSMAVPVGTGGQAVTAYALGVAIGGPVVTVATARWPRKPLALGLCGLFVAGLLITVAAPTFMVLLAGRVLSACAQATLFAIALTSAVEALGPQRAGQAVAIVGSGLTVATVLGVPLGVLLGGHDWRAPFVVVAALATAGAVALVVLMPRQPAPATDMGDEVRSLVRVPVLLAIATTVAGFAGVGVVFTYLVPLLTDVTRIGDRWIPALLLLYGLGGFVGNLVAGRLADTNLTATLLGVVVTLGVVLVVFPAAAPHPGPALVLVLLLGLLSTATVAPLQSLVLRHAATAPTLALAVNVGAFNLANAIGSAIGGWSVAHQQLAHSGWLAAPLIIVALVLALLALHQPTPEGEAALTMITRPASESSDRMTAAAITRYGGSDAITLLDLPIPQPGPGEALVAVTATTINPVDLKFRTPGTPQNVDHFPKVLGWDLAGIVVSAPAAAQWRTGDRVIAMRPPSDDGLGCWAQYVIVPAEHLAPAPHSTDLTTAATLPLAGLTAAQALAALHPARGSRLLVTGAAGAVGGLAVQLGRTYGLHVTALVSRPEHVQPATALGAHAATANPADLEAFDFVLDTAGVLNHPHLLTPGGRLVTISDDPLPTWAADKQASAQRNYVTHDPEGLLRLVRLTDAGDLSLRVGAIHPLQAIVTAHDRTEQGGQLGKTTLIT